MIQSLKTKNTHKKQEVERLYYGFTRILEWIMEIRLLAVWVSLLAPKGQANIGVL